MASGSPWTDRRLSLPRVNLLPKGIRARKLLQRQRSGVAVAFVLLLALLGLWYVRESQKLTEARREADQQRAVAAGLEARKAALQPYAALESQVAAAEQLRAKVYAREIRFSSILQDISAIIPADVWLTQMNVAFNDAGAQGAAGGGTAAPAAPAAPGATGTAPTPGSPGAGSPVATITFTGAGLGHVDVGGFMRALAAGPKKRGARVYLNPYFTASQKGAQGGEATVTFSATVDLSQAAFSGRFQPAGQQGTVTP
jgi:type II secretory pathway pseudopilin PulG